MTPAPSEIVGALVVLAVVTMITITAICIAKSAPTRLVRSLVAVSALLATIPPILLALYSN